MTSGPLPQLRPPPPSPHAAMLLNALRKPSTCFGLDASQWDILIRAARRARLLGTLAFRLDREPDLAPPSVAKRMLHGARLEARFRRQKVVHLLDAVKPQLNRTASCAVLLKGAAYVMQKRDFAVGRMPADVDIMVRRAELPVVEAALLDAGWQGEQLEPYDDHYYRAWTHELPPMRCAGQALELDLHHAILPPFGTARPDMEMMLADSVPVADGTFRVLSSVDQVLHVAAHLFQDSDCTNRLRDLVDFALLLEEVGVHQCAEDMAERIVVRSQRFGLSDALAYTAAFAGSWMRSRGALAIASTLEARSFGTRYGRSRWVVCLAAKSLPPPHPDSRPALLPGAALQGLLAARSVWLRMPVRRVAIHVLTKAWRTVRRGLIRT